MEGLHIPSYIIIIVIIIKPSGGLRDGSYIF